MHAEVTAVVTTRARPQHVFDAIASLRAETHESVEIVVVDDGGEFEATRDVLGRHGRVVRGGAVGVAGARNLGLAAARGEFVIFLDDDDVALPHRISVLLREARRTAASLCFGLTRRVIAGSALSMLPVPTHHTGGAGSGFCDLLTCNPHVNAVLARTESLRRAGGFDAGASHFDDWSVWLRIADAGEPVTGIGEVVAEWRMHDRGLSAGILSIRAMKARLLGLFDRVEPALTVENARAVALARSVVRAHAIVTYDDYVSAMSATRDALHASGECLGRAVASHGIAYGTARARELAAAT